MDGRTRRPNGPTTPPRLAPPARRGPLPAPPDQAAILALQRQAGNAAVASALVGGASRRPPPRSAAPTPPAPTPPASATDQERARAIVQRWIARNVQRAPDGPTAGAAQGGPTIVPGIATVSVGKIGLVNQDAPVDDVFDGVRLRDQPAPTGALLGHLPHNRQLFIESEAPGGWYKVVAVDGASGWVAKQYVVTQDLMPDPGSKLHRIKPGETAFDIAAKYYGSAAFTSGNDARFYSNVLVYANAERDRKGIRAPTDSEKVQLLKSGGYGKYMDAWTVAGAQIWVPSKEFALALKGTVSAGSFARDAWEKGKSLLLGAAEFLVKIPAFVGGLIVGVGESLVDTVVGILDLVKKIVTGEIVSDIKTLIDVLGDSKKREELAEHLKGEFLAKWNHTNPIKKWYWRGWIFGYVIGEILAAVLTSAAGAALKGTKIAQKAAKLGAEFTAAVKKLGPVAKASAKAAEVAASKPVVRVLAAASVVKNVPAKVMEFLGDIWEKYSGKASKAVKLEQATKAVALMAAKFGFPEERIARLVELAAKYDLRIWIRKGNPASLKQLEKGAIPKPELLKAKSITPEDLHLYPKLKPDDVGLTGYFKPVKPPKAPPNGVTTAEWKKVRDRYKERLAEFKNQKEVMDVLSRPYNDPIRLKYEKTFDADMIVKVDENGVVKIVEAETGVTRNVAGDMDIFDITAGNGAPAKRGGYIDNVLLEADLTEHGPHMWWNPKSKVDKGIDLKILKSHESGGLLEIGPDGVLREARGADVPGFMARLKAAKAWW